MESAFCQTPLCTHKIKAVNAKSAVTIFMFLHIYVVTYMYQHTTQVLWILSQYMHTSSWGGTSALQQDWAWLWWCGCLKSHLILNTYVHKWDVIMQFDIFCFLTLLIVRFSKIQQSRLEYTQTHTHKHTHTHMQTYLLTPHTHTYIHSLTHTTHTHTNPPTNTQTQQTHTHTHMHARKNMYIDK